MSHPPLHDPDRYPRLQIRLWLGPDCWIGPGKADLLELIDETGSIAQAGRRMGMSYKRAWSLVEGMNRMFGEPLVTSERGGAGGGGAQLTDTGTKALHLFRGIQRDAARASKAGTDAILQLQRKLPNPKRSN
ncbi:LysR family transcriptional regulator [Paracoccus aurantiacus]|uniref:LysR family transcriptional regulator n=1 Tax=Paracoccus aurantiacus TaxID=2599412 RepID=A0A5C6S1J1_9RHOB|nr:LysR family transcriptional regulator [Paracoccus aurantiacus]TXB67502.1 LysR family transcriptional regulator [Paracoccus aurantiacus]